MRDAATGALPDRVVTVRGARMKIKYKQKEAARETLPLIPNYCIAIDIVDFGERRRTTEGRYRYVLTVIDHATRFLSWYPVRNNTGREVARILFDHWICVFGRVMMSRAPGVLNALPGRCAGIAAARSGVVGASPRHEHRRGRCRPAVARNRSNAELGEQKPRNNREGRVAG